MGTHATPHNRMPRPIASRSIPYPRFSDRQPSWSLVQNFRHAPLGANRVAYTLDYGDLHRRGSVQVNGHAPFIFPWPACPRLVGLWSGEKISRPITVSVIEMCV